MPYLTGVLTGIVLTILAVFVIDNVGDEADSRDIVNWDFVGAQLGATAEKVGKEVRDEVHEATKPDPGEPAPAPDASDTPSAPETGTPAPQ